ncbi:S8 family peptidase [Streptomyces sp. NPDC003023]|uniref:S8 family peptidase n=1 Tax=Streptomyces sp. NPDC003023 TaxID=3364675 RepID=UPI00369E3CD8
MTFLRKAAAVVAAGLLSAGAQPAVANTISPSVPDGRHTAGTSTAGTSTARTAEGDTASGRYIVMLKDSAVLSGSTAGRAIAEKYGTTVVRVYRTAVNGYSVQATEAQARRLAKDPAVLSVTRNRTFHTQAVQRRPASWGLDRIDQRSRTLDSRYVHPGKAGEGVTVYVIDTGVRITHQEFGGRASYGYDAVDDDPVAQDDSGHGTHVAAIAAGKKYGVAKKAEIVAVRVLDGLGNGSTEQVVAGIDWVTRHAVKPAVANISISGGADPVVDRAVQRSIASGITYTVAAGNENRDAAAYSPARVPEAVTVGATTKDDARYELSNHGPAVDIFAPGDAIVSAWNSSDRAFLADWGTSMAAPHVAGAAALYLAGHPAATPRAVSAALIGAATTGVVSDRLGSPDRLLNTGP